MVMATLESSISQAPNRWCVSNESGGTSQRKGISQPKRGWLFLKVKESLFGSQVLQKLEQTPCYFSEKT